MGPVCSRTYVFQEIIGSILNRPGEVGRYHREDRGGPAAHRGTRVEESKGLELAIRPLEQRFFVNLQYFCCFLVSSGLFFAK